MLDFWTVLGVAFGLVMVIEGALYALFPGGMQRMMAMAMNMAPDRLRMAGLVFCFLGTGLVWLLVG